MFSVFGQNRVSGLDARAKALQKRYLFKKTCKEHIFEEWVVAYI